jgi:AdoMet-dependent rRNA methyltransferase SPB1
MTTPMEIGMEQEGEAMFGLKSIDKVNGLSKVSKGKMDIVVDDEDEEGQQEEEEETEDEDGDRLEDELDQLYEEYQERKSEADAKYRAKKARTELDDGEWHGFSDSDKDESSDEEDDAVDQSSDSDSDSDEEEDAPKKLVTTLDDENAKGKNGLSKKAALFFNQDIFGDIDDGLGEDDDCEEGKSGSGAGSDENDEDEEDEDEEMEWEEEDEEEKAFSDDEPNGFEIVKKKTDDAWDADEDDVPMKNGRPGKTPPYPPTLLLILSLHTLLSIPSLPS